jgi:hypothetical protein
VQLDRDHTRADGDEFGAQRAGTGTDVEHEVARPDVCVGDDTGGPTISEPVPPPSARRGGAHDAPWSRRWLPRMSPYASAPHDAADFRDGVRGQTASRSRAPVSADGWRSFDIARASI